MEEISYSFTSMYRCRMELQSTRACTNDLYTTPRQHLSEEVLIQLHAVKHVLNFTFTNFLFLDSFSDL